jgi:hypothetical protein
MHAIQRERQAQTHERTATEIMMENQIPAEWGLPARTLTTFELAAQQMTQPATGTGTELIYWHPPEANPPGEAGDAGQNVPW